MADDTTTSRELLYARSATSMTPKSLSIFMSRSLWSYSSMRHTWVFLAPRSIPQQNFILHLLWSAGFGTSYEDPVLSSENQILWDDGILNTGGPSSPFIIHTEGGAFNNYLIGFPVGRVHFIYLF